MERREREVRSNIQQLRPVDSGKRFEGRTEEEEEAD